MKQATIHSSRLKSRNQPVKCAPHAGQVGSDLLFGYQKQRSDDDGEWRDGADPRSGVQGCGRRQVLHELAADDRRCQEGNIVPQPLLINKSPAFVEPLPVLHQDGAGQCARNRHRVRGDQKCESESIRRVDLRDPKIAGDRRHTGDEQIAFAAIAEQRQEIGNQAVDRLDHPGQSKDSAKGGDLRGCPASHLLQIIDERLRDESAGLA